MIFVLEPDAGGTIVQIHTDMQLSGSDAQHGRSPGMIADLAGRDRQVRKSTPGGD